MSHDVIPEEDGGDIIPAQRQRKLLEWIEINRAASIQDLSRRFSMSISTIRRDLDAMAAGGLVRRTHGGAVAVRHSMTSEPSILQASLSAVDEKRAIARAAARRLENEQSIMLDTGSAIYPLAKIIAETPIPLTVITSDVKVAGILAGHSHIKLLLPGGTCRYKAYTLLGEPGLSMLRQIRCDRMFLSAQALDGDCVSDTSLELVNLKRTMMASSRTVTLMIDSSRIGDRAIYEIAPLASINEVITDTGLRDRHAALITEAGIRLERAELPENTQEDS